MDNNSQKYTESLARLKKHLYARELQRQKWANENWSHPGGNIFKTSRIAIPILSAFALFICAIYAILRYQMLFYSEFLKALGATTTYTVEPVSIHVSVAFTAVFGIILLIGVIMIIRNKMLGGTRLSLVCSGILLINLIININIGLPDNSLFDEAPMFSYFQIVITGIILLSIIFLLSASVVGIYINERRELNRSAEHILLKISAGSNEMLTSDDYAEKINEFIAKDIEKEKEDREYQKKRKRSKSK